MDFEIPRDEQATEAARKAAAAARVGAFRGRSGHGGGPCTQRHLDGGQLGAIVEAACLVAIGVDRAEEKADRLFAIGVIRHEADRVEKSRREWGIKGSEPDPGVAIAREVADRLERRIA